MLQTLKIINIHREGALADLRQRTLGVHNKVGYRERDGIDRRKKE